MQSLISIIIPTFNRASIIEETLDSIRSQTYVNWECIIVDDGSIDGTKEIIMNYIKMDARFRFYERPITKIKGPSACRNYGLKLSRGEFINWFDSDDLMLGEFLETRIKIFNEIIDADIVFCAFGYFCINGTQNRGGNVSFSGDIFKDWKEEKTIFGPPSFLIRKNILKGMFFDEQLQRTEDVDYFFKLFTTKKPLKIQHVPDRLFMVRKHLTNITSQNDELGVRLKSTFIVHKRILSYFIKSGDHKLISKYFKYCMVDLQRLLVNKNYKLVIQSIIDFEFLNFSQKSYLVICVLTELTFGRGSGQFKKLKV